MTEMPSSITGLSTRDASAALRLPLFMILLVSVFSYIDRQILPVVLDPVKTELGVSDTQMGLLNGLGFAIFYSAACLSLSRLADRSVRRNIIVLSVAAWSVVTMLSGVAQNYVQMMLCRMGVAIGEAGAQPSSYSIIYDMAPREKLLGSLSFIQVGIAIGLGLGMFLAGLLNDLIGWRLTFIALGLPGLLLALGFFLLVPEPRRAPAGDVPRPGLFRALAQIWKVPAIRPLVFAPGLASISGYALLMWLPTFFVRVHHLSTTQVGMFLGLATTISMAIGAFAAGRIADHFSHRGRRSQLHIAAFAILLAFPAAAGALFAVGVGTALFSYAIYSVFAMALPPICFGVAMSLAPETVRATASALMSTLLNLVGITIGPFIVGALNDLLKPHFGAASIQISLTVALFGLPIAAGAIFLSGRRIPPA